MLYHLSYVGISSILQTQRRTTSRVNRVVFIQGYCKLPRGAKEKTMIRAKFRCMSKTTHAEQPTELRFLPANPKCSSYPEGCEENKAFWEATPSGEMAIHIKKGADVPYIVGDFYYIDMERAEVGDNLWKLWEISQQEHNVNVKFGLGWDPDRDVVHAELEMGIENAVTWLAFLGNAGTKWSVTFKPAS